MKPITKDQLRMYNGRRGKPAYIAFMGKIYDVSSLYKDGEHMSCIAGNDLTDILPMMPHGTAVLENFEIVGELID